MLYDARVTARKITKPRNRCNRANLIFAAILISINVVNLTILTRCTTDQNSDKSIVNTVSADNLQTIDYAGNLHVQRAQKESVAPAGGWIPKIVHITWKSTAIPGTTAEWVKKWTKTNPDYSVWFWTDEDANDFVKRYYTDFYPTFNNYKTGIFRADAMRYLILFHYGGIYADLDIEPLKSLDPIREKYACVVSREPAAHAQIAWNLPENKNLACNAFMACRPRHPFLRLVIDILDMRGTKETNPVVATGPLMLTKTLKMYNNMKKQSTSHIKGGPDSVFLAPSKYFIPRVDQLVIDRLLPQCGSPSLSKKFLKFCKEFSRGDFHNGWSKESYTDHHWWHSWFMKEKTTKPESIASVIPYVTLARSVFEGDSAENDDL